MPPRKESTDSSADAWTELECSSVASSAQWTLVDDDDESLDADSRWSRVLSLPSRHSSKHTKGFRTVCEETVFEASPYVGEDSEWKDESRLKLERASQFGASRSKRAHLHGKRGRRCLDPVGLGSSTLERSNLNDQVNRYSLVNNPTKREYMMTGFDLSHPGSMSFNKRREWDTLLPELIAHAQYGLSTRHMSDRKMYVFDLPVEGIFVDEKRKDAVMGVRERISLSLRKRIPSKLQFFTYRENVHPLRHRTVAGEQITEVLDEAVFYEMVRPAGLPPAVELGPKEEYASVKMKFASKSTKQQAGSTLNVDDMMRESLVTDELRSARNHMYYSEGYGAIPASDRNHKLCWISDPPPHADYDEWFMEVDLGMRHTGGRFVRALVIQGQLPQIESFPTCNHFASNDAYRRYTGAIFPVVRWQSLEQRCWVERFEVLARTQKGAWFSLGVFRGNCDAWSQVRVDLPAVAEMKLRFLRVRPLSKNKQGYHGPTPAFRLGVVALKAGNVMETTTQRPISGLRELMGTALSMDTPETVDRIVRNLPPCPPRVAPGYIRYEVLLPHRDLRTRRQKGDESSESPSSRRRKNYIVDRSYNCYRHFREGDKYWRKLRPPAHDIAQSVLQVDRLQTLSDAIRRRKDDSED